MKKVRRLWTALFVTGILLGTSSVALAAEEIGDFTVTGGVLDTDYTYAEGILTIQTATPITIRNTDPDTATTDKLLVNSPSADITLDGVNIVIADETVGCAFMLADGIDAVITLADGSVNRLESDGLYAGLNVPGNTTVTIQAPEHGAGTGTLAAYGDQSNSYGGGAGIGGNRLSSPLDDGSVGTINIGGGTVIAIGGSGNNSGAGIGGGFKNKGNGAIHISGGTVLASGGQNGAGIGSSYQGTAIDVSITGGIVTATGGASGIGAGSSGASGALTVTGNSFVNASSISNTSTISAWSGLVYNGSDGTIYGESTTLEGDVTISDGKTLTIASNQTLTVNQGATFRNNGRIDNQGIINGAGTLDCTDGLFRGVSPSNGITYIPSAFIENPVFNLETDGDLRFKSDWNILRYYTSQSGTWKSYTGSMTISGETTAYNINVESGIHNITLDGVTIQNLDSWQGAPISINNTATANITLADGSVNTLKSSGSNAALGVDGDAIVTIGGNGTLNAIGDAGCSGIGGVPQHDSVGSITIKSGTINAMGGAGYQKYEMICTDGAGIGLGGYQYYSFNSPNDTRTYTGFSTGENGTAFINTNSISNTDSVTSDWHGVIFEGNHGFIYGTDIALSADAEVPAGKTLTIDNGATLSLAKGVILTNSGTITIEADSVLDCTKGNVVGTITEGDGKYIEPLTIESFTVGDYVVAMDTELLTVRFTVPFSSDVTAITPVIALSSYASINPATNVATDFSNGSVTYTVTGGDTDATEQIWTVTAIRAAETDAEAVVRAKVAAEEITYADPIDSNDYASETALATYVKAIAVEGVADDEIGITVNQTSYTAPVNGTKEVLTGTPGSYSFTVTLSKGNETQTTTAKTIAIPAIDFELGKYPVIEGDQATIEGGTREDITIKVEGDLEKFLGLYLADEEVDTAHYVAESGSVILTLKADYVATLAVGTQTFEMLFTDGTANMSLTVTQPAPTSSGSIPYSSKVAPTEHGTVTISNQRNKLNSTVTITVTPNQGYEVGSVVVTKSGGNTVTVKAKGNDTYSYLQPGATATVTVTFAKISDETVADIPFEDVSEDAYYYDAVCWAVSKGITKGTTDTTFSPDASCTRAQAVTFLWNAAGKPQVEGSHPFKDVPEDVWYYDAVLWAVSEGITKGVSDTTFAPDAICTRAQIVTLLWNATGKPVVNYLMTFEDVVGETWYSEAVRWAVSDGITSGTSNTAFEPNATCSRGQIVTFLHRNVAD